MAEPLADQVMRKIKQADEHYHRLMLVVAPAGAGKATAIQDVKERVGNPLINVNQRILMREFEEYRESKQKCLKVFRLEAVRASFKKVWQKRDYATIIAVARKITNKNLQEDPKFLMWYDQAVTRFGGEE